MRDWPGEFEHWQRKKAWPRDDARVPRLRRRLTPRRRQGALVITELRVRDLAVIQDVTLELGPGLNVLTGETGAGKSMLIDALALLLGERATGDLVRAGSRKTIVEGVFDLSSLSHLHDRIGALGLDLEDGVLVIRREVVSGGRSRAWVSGSPTTVAVLAELGTVLVDLHGQHETQSLLHAEAQRDMLDALSDAESDRKLVSHVFGRRATLRAEVEQVTTRRDAALRRADYLRHVVQEIDRVAPVAGEDERLEAEARRLGHAEELRSLAESVAETVDGDEAELRARLTAAARALEQLARLDPDTAAWGEWLESAFANLNELSGAATEYASAIDPDPDRLREIDERRRLLFDLFKKYGSTIEDVLSYRAESATELDVLDTADHTLAGLHEQLDAAQRELAAACTALSSKRKRGGRRLGRDVTKLLPDLGMPEGEMRVRLEELSQPQAEGRERVEFEVRLNRGLPPRALARVASGGELSRLMLGLKVVLAEHDALPSVVFDEVDQGVGGEVGGQVGRYLAQVARHRQVLVITHLPQIAALADRHIIVRKDRTGAVATSDVEVVTGEGRVAEVARMLGDPDAVTARRLAAELITASSESTRAPASRRSLAPNA